jgi:hypothetical protein
MERDVMVRVEMRRGLSRQDLEDPDLRLELEEDLLGREAVRQLLPRPPESASGSDVRQAAGGRCGASRWVSTLR